MEPKPSHGTHANAEAEPQLYAIICEATSNREAAEGGFPDYCGSGD